MEAHEFRRQLIPGHGNTRLEHRLWQSDIGQIKRAIKQQLIDNEDIRKLLGDEKLEALGDPAEYLYKAIYPYLLIPDAMHEQKAYICFKVDDADTNYYENVRKENPLMKVVEIQFMVVVHNGVVETDYGIDRHDGLAYLIREIFSYSEKLFGFKMRCVSDIEGVTDSAFVTRTLTFEVEQPANLDEFGRRKNQHGN